MKSKIGRKNHYLEKSNQKNGRKFYYSQKILVWKEYNFPSGFLTNTISNFAQELFLPVTKKGSKSTRFVTSCKRIMTSNSHETSFHFVKCPLTSRSLSIQAFLNFNTYSGEEDQSVGKSKPCKKRSLICNKEEDNFLKWSCKD